MNPDETKKRADLRHCYLADEATRIASLRTVGVTEEYTPELFGTIMEYTDRTYESIGKTEDFDFVPTAAGNDASLRRIPFSGDSSAGGIPTVSADCTMRNISCFSRRSDYDGHCSDCVYPVQGLGNAAQLPQQSGAAEAFLCGLSFSAGSRRTRSGISEKR